MSEHPHLPPLNLESPQSGLITLPSKEHFAELERQYQANEAVRQQQLKEHNAAYDRRTWKMRMKKTLAATALFATAQSGGFADLAADPFNDAGDTVRSATTIEPVSIPDEMDGIAFKDYPKSAQIEFVAEEESRVERQTAAQQSVVELFDRIDGDGTEWLVAEVNAEKAAHPELFVANENIERSKQLIDDAASNTEAVGYLDDFMKEYGIRAGFDDHPYENMESQTKQALKAYVNVFGVLPKDFVKLTNLKKVSVSAETKYRYDENGEKDGTLRGSYGPDSHDIVVYADSALEAAMVDVGQFATAIDASYEQTVAHELGHAISHEMPVGASLPDDLSDNSKVIVNGVEHTARTIIGRPEVPSLYSFESGDSEEYAAELLAGLLSDTNGGLVLPHEVRRFTSTSNKELIRMLANLEEEYPGIARILIANRAS